LPRRTCVLVPFVTAAPPSADPTPRPDPHQDRPAGSADTPSRTGRFLGLVRKLIDYGRQLAATLQQRPSATQLWDTARDFGSRDIALILARITRGLLLAGALEARLVSRPLPEQTRAAPARAPSPRAPRAARPAAPRAERPEDPRLAGLPTPEQIAAEVRRRPVGVVLADICRDLGIVACHPLWAELELAIMDGGGNFVRLWKDVSKRARAARRAEPPADAPPGWPAPWPQIIPVRSTGPP